MTNPTLISTPFANTGTKNTIPNSGASEPQLATMEGGFPEITQTPIAEGGIPPERADFNGILNLYGQHIVHLNKGLPYEFDAAFALEIGGYPLNSRIALSTGKIVVSTIPSNINDPNMNMTGWVKDNSASQIFDASGLSQQTINNSAVTNVYSLNDLRAYKRTVHASIVNVLMHTDSYRGGGYFRFDSAATLPDDNGVIIKPTDIIGSGRWIRMYDNQLTTDCFALYLRNDDVTSTLQYMDTLADTIHVNKGEYLISDFMPSKKYIFEDDAWFTSNTTERTNAIIVQSGLRMINPRVKLNVSIPQVDGDYGSAFRIGTYRQPDDINVEVCNVEIINPLVELVHPTNSGQGFEILGNAYDIKIENPDVKGRGFGIVAHWGAHNVGLDGHGSQVTRTYHPHNIEIINPVFSSADNVDGWTGRMQTGLILSACYNVRVTNVKTDGLVNSVYVMAGDVYAQEAIDRDKYNIYTNITIDGVDVRNYKDGSTPVTVLGITDTRRTSSAPTAAISKDQNIRVALKNININVPRSTDTSNLILVRYAKNVEVQANVWGEVLHGGAMCYFDTCINSSVNIYGFAKNGIITRSLRNCDVNIYSDRYPTSNASGEYGIECRALSYSGSFSASGGSTTLVYIPNQDVVVFDGSAIYKDGVLIGYIKASKECKASVQTTLQCTPLANGMSFGESNNSMILYNSDVRYSGLVSGYYRNFYGTNLKDSTVSATNKFSHTSGIVLDGAVTSGVSFKNFTMMEVNHTGASASTACYISATSVNNLTFEGVKFDPNKLNTKLQRYIEVSSANHSGIKIVDCDGTQTTSGTALLIPTSTVTSGFQVHLSGNSFNTTNVNSLGSAVGAYNGGVYYGTTREATPPSSGYWRLGDRVLRQPVVGQTQGWVCTVGGATPTWTPLANL